MLYDIQDAISGVDFYDADGPGATHDCCRNCDTPVCCDDMDCRCGLPKYDDHEGSSECKTLAGGQGGS